MDRRPHSPAPFASGYPDGTFRPDRRITRAEFTRMLHRAVGSPPGPPGHGFSDVASWVAEGVATGFPDGTYRPDQPVTRGQVTRMLYRLSLD